jgi:hypothetical protein
MVYFVSIMSFISFVYDCSFTNIFTQTSDRCRRGSQNQITRPAVGAASSAAARVGWLQVRDDDFGDKIPLV